MEDKKWTVYKHTCPNGKVYIGITSVKPEYRWNNGKGYTGSKYFNNAIKKYGWDNIDHEILFTNMNEKEAKDMERQLIAQYNSNNPQFGYNMTKGGDGTLGIKRSKEQIEYLKSVLSKSIYQRDLNGKLIKKWQSVRSIEKELGYARSNITQCCKHKTYQAYGFLWSYDKDYIKQKKRRKNCKTVYQYDLDGNFIQEWESVSEIHQTLGYSKQNISHCCLGELNSVYGYIWTYDKNTNIEYKNKNLQKQKKIYQLTRDGRIIKQWDSLDDISNSLGYNKSAISQCCLCKSKTAYGYIWRYDDTLHRNISLVPQNAKKVYQLDQEGNVIAEFPSVSEAQKVTKINNISNCCLGQYKTAGGYVWKYSDS